MDTASYRGALWPLKIVPKASDGQCPAWAGCAWSWGGSRAAAPKGSMTYVFTHMGDCVCWIWRWEGQRPPRGQCRMLRLRYERWGLDLNNEAGIWAIWLGLEPLGWGDLRVGSQPRAWNWNLEAGIAVSELGLANRSLKATIWASRLELEPWGLDWGLEIRIRALRQGLSFCLSIYLSNYLPVYLSICSSVCLSVCLFFSFFCSHFLSLSLSILD